MQLNLIRNGYNVDRRKMYSQNPRNNLLSSVDFVWKQSLENENNFITSKLKNKINNEKQSIKKYYDSLVDKQIQIEKSIDKNSFRIMPAFKSEYSSNTNQINFKPNYKRYQINENQNNNKNNAQFFKQISSVPQNYQNIYNKNRQESLNIMNHQKRPNSKSNHNFKLTTEQVLNPSSYQQNNNNQINQLKSSRGLSKTVFGYEINPQTFKRESYLSKILSDRLNPYLEQVNKTNIIHKRHKSISGVNQIIDMNY